MGKIFKELEQLGSNMKSAELFSLAKKLQKRADEERWSGSVALGICGVGNWGEIISSELPNTSISIETLIDRIKAKNKHLDDGGKPESFRLHRPRQAEPFSAVERGMSEGALAEALFKIVVERVRHEATARALGQGSPQAKSEEWPDVNLAKALLKVYPSLDN